MGHRLSKLYTRTGDGKTTGLSDQTRVDKSSLRIEAIGDIDELNSVTGLLITQKIPDDIAKILKDIQHILFNMGGEISLPDSVLVSKNHVLELEQLIDSYNEKLPPLHEFILPGGNQAASICHMARAVCRRAERSVVKLAHDENLNNILQVYLNRLSDLLFVFARLLYRQDSKDEVYWDSERLKNI